MPLAAERLREVLRYSKRTGVFTWRVLSNNKWKKAIAGGAPAGAINAAGYRVIGIDNKLYYAHRLAWLYVHGNWPAKQLDHKNGTPDDNRFCNLREATDTENRYNCRLPTTNTIKLKGAWFSKIHNRWVSQIRVAGRRIYVGTFTTAEAAHAAWCKAAVKYHGEFARFR